MSKPIRESRISGFLSVIAERQTYKNLLYLVVAFPLAVGYYVLLSVGFTLGIALSILVVGLGILAATVIGVRYIAAFERWLANRLLGTKIPTPSDVEDAGDGVITTVKAYLRAPSTWRGLGFILLKFFLGILSFILLVSFLGTALELLLLPLVPEGAFHVQIVGWRVAQSFETTTQRIVAVPIGAVLVFGSLHILNAFAKANARIAVSLLKGEASSDGKA
ncbi:sensor domain-containing protein [Halobacterium sp. KA-4]|uniref:sensor domain-containing protein n=1 Tax=Halobacterium sp. KA-4 TaxID=2896367 RepID=UPI001E6587D7|nr:sensor domain-containing protein [Halobacterium sp. KA-4]MCD2200437.1 sensor domain-containing protein [Halobacterium sp. KA-4]